MIALSLADIAAATDGRTASLRDDTATQVTSDSRQVTAGSLFIAIRGARADGHSFLAQVFADGAVGALVEESFLDSAEYQELVRADPDAAQRLIAVPHTVAAVGAVARLSLARLRERSDVRVVAITGSVGKTSTKDLIATILRGTQIPAQDPRVISPPGSFNNELGLPLTVLRATEQTEVLVLEMGADHIGNIAELTAIAPPDVAVVLAVGRAHLGEFGGIDAVARAKSEMVTGALPSATVVLNGDDERVAAMADLASLTVSGEPLPAPRRLWHFGRGMTRPSTAEPAPDPEISASQIRLDDGGRAHFTLHINGHRAGEVALGLVGEHHVSNALAAAGVAAALGIDPEVIVARLSGATATSPHRMHLRERSDGTLVLDDAYNANPESMRAALRALDTLGTAQVRRIAVLGDMLELGESTRAEHQDIGQVVAAHGVEVLLAVGEYAQYYLDGAAAHGQREADIAVGSLEQAAETLNRLVQESEQRSIVLVKGSNGSRLWALADEFATGGERR